MKMLASTLFSEKVNAKLRLSDQTPKALQTLEEVLNDPELTTSLVRKMGNLIGHLMEDVHTAHLKKLGLDVQAHPYGQKFSPDHIIRHGGELWWVEHKNCAEDKYKKFDLINFAKYAHYKHSDRKGDETVLKELKLKFSDQDVLSDALNRKEPFSPDRAILAISLYPVTGKLDDWRYIRWDKVPLDETPGGHLVHTQRPKPPIDVSKDERKLWTDNIFHILEGNQ